MRRTLKTIVPSRTIRALLSPITLLFFIMLIVLATMLELAGEKKAAESLMGGFFDFLE